MHDLVVIGDDLSSYIAAAVGVKFGLKTLHIVEHSLKEMSLSDIFFNADPSPVTGFGDGQSVISLFKELGIKIEKDDLFHLSPAYQIILPEQRVDFAPQQEDVLADLIREFPHKAKRIKSFYKSVRKNSDFLEKWISAHPFFRVNSFKQYFNYFKLFIKLITFDWRINKFRRVLLDDSSLRKIYEAQLAFLSADNAAAESLSSFYHFSTPWRGTFGFPKGKTYLMESLRNFFENSGGIYKSDCRLSSIRKSHCLDAEIMDERGLTSQISAKNIVISHKSEALNVFYKKKKKINTTKWLQRFKTTHYPLTLHFVISEKSLPEKMARHVLLVSDTNKHIFDDNLIILDVNNPDMEKRSTQGRKLVAATVFLSADKDDWQREKLLVAAEKTIARLENFLPFLKDNVKFYDINKSIDISTKYRNVANAKYKVKKALFSGFSAQKNKTSLRGVYLCGAALFTDMGCFEGEIISGMYAVYSVLKPRKKP